MTVLADHPQTVTACNALAQLIRSSLAEADIDFRTAAGRTEGLISPSNLNRYATGKASNPSSSTLLGISIATGRPLDEVRAAAGVPVTPGPFELPDRAHRLTVRERQAVITVIDAMLDARGSGEGGLAQRSVVVD